jgi:hypothetical protein
MEQGGRDRYDSLLRHLQAGRQVQVQPRRRRRLGLDVHPAAGKVLLGAAVIVVLWLGAITVSDWIRRDAVSTWAGPDTGVTSGKRLTGCADLSFPEDVYFPDWIRFDGRLYRWTDESTPIGTASFSSTYQASGYTLGDLELFRIINTPDGRDGKRIMVRQGDAYAGAIYVLSDCAA